MASAATVQVKERLDRSGGPVEEPAAGAEPPGMRPWLSEQLALAHAEAAGRGRAVIQRMMAAKAAAAVPEQAPGATGRAGVAQQPVLEEHRDLLKAAAADETWQRGDKNKPHSLEGRPNQPSSMVSAAGCLAPHPFCCRPSSRPAWRV